MTNPPENDLNGISEKKDHFPDTVTWIDRKLELGHDGLQEIRHHIMAVYAKPLKIYFMGRSDRWLGDPDEVVIDFLTDRLGRDDYLSKWKSFSGYRLRYWLIKGLDFYLLELRKKRQKDQRFQALPDEDCAASREESVERSFDREFIKVLISEALLLGEKICKEDKLSQHWEVFRRHSVENQSYGDIITTMKLDMDTERAAVMNRTATKRFRSAIRKILMRDGISYEMVGREIQYLVEVISE